MKYNFFNNLQFVKVLAVLCIVSLNSLNAQNILQTKRVLENFPLTSRSELESFLEKKYHFSDKQFKIEKVYETESLTGKHFDFAIFYNNIPLKEVFLKVHINKQNQIFLIQENFSSIKNIPFENNEFSKEKVIRDLYEVYSLEDIKEAYVLKNSSFHKSLNIKLINERKDVYLERNYTSETEFTERDLKVHFAPTDTTIYGKVFMPDPLSSAHEIYGGNYQDAFTKDTTVLIAKRIPNVGQANIISYLDSFTLNGVKFEVEAVSFPNNYSGDTVYYYFQDIYSNVENEILGYNVRLSDDLTSLKTELKIEDYDYEELNAEQYNIEVKGGFSDSKFHLKNNLFEISELSLPLIEPTTSVTKNFNFKRSHSSFEDINAYYHLNNYHSYIADLGFTTLSPKKIKVDAHGNNGADNSYFTNSPSPRLVFGEGGVDDAEDAAVVIHEYVHALSDFASPNSNIGLERQALDEALGDYLSASYSATFGNFNKGLVFPWDGHNEFWSGRISNSDSTYATLNLNHSIYANAEIMSATLTDIFDEIGKETTDILVIESMFYNVANDSFMAVANNLLLIDSLLFNNDHKCAIYEVLVKRKFKSGFCIGKSLVFKNGFYTTNTEGFSNNTDKAKFYIIENNFEKMDVWISNSLGKIVFKQLNIQEPKMEIDPKNFSSGIFYVRFQTTNEKHLTKILKY